MFELMIVVAIIGILAAIVILQCTEVLKSGFRAELDASLKNAYAAAQTYFSDYPSGTVDALVRLTASGYQKSTKIYSTVIASMMASNGTIALAHSSPPSGKGTGTVSSGGVISMPAQYDLLN